MSETQIHTGAAAAPLAGTPWRDLIAGGLAFGVVILGANLLSHSLKGVIEDSVRTGAVGVLFAGVPGVYGIFRKLLVAIGPKRSAPSPELTPWYITGLFAGACLFSWVQLFGFIIGVGAGVAGMYAGQSGGHDTLRLAGMLSGVLQIPLILIWSIFAGTYLYKHTRSLLALAVLLAVLIVLGLNAFMNFVVLPDATAQLLRAMESKSSNDIIIGNAIMAGALLIGMLIGALIGGVRRLRYQAALVSLARNLDKDSRKQLLEDVRARVLSQV